MTIDSILPSTNNDDNSHFNGRNDFFTMLLQSISYSIAGLITATNLDNYAFFGGISWASFMISNI